MNRSGKQKKHSKFDGENGPELIPDEERGVHLSDGRRRTPGATSRNEKKYTQGGNYKKNNKYPSTKLDQDNSTSSSLAMAPTVNPPDVNSFSYQDPSVSSTANAQRHSTPRTRQRQREPYRQYTGGNDYYNDDDDDDESEMRPGAIPIPGTHPRGGGGDGASVFSSISNASVSVPSAGTTGEAAVAAARGDDSTLIEAELAPNIEEEIERAIRERERNAVYATATAAPVQQNPTSSSSAPHRTDNDNSNNDIDSEEASGQKLTPQQFTLVILVVCCCIIIIPAGVVAALLGFGHFDDGGNPNNINDVTMSPSLSPMPTSPTNSPIPTSVPSEVPTNMPQDTVPSEDVVPSQPVVTPTDTSPVADGGGGDGNATGDSNGGGGDGDGTGDSNGGGGDGDGTGDSNGGFSTLPPVDFSVRLSVSSSTNSLAPVLEWYCQQNDYCFVAPSFSLTGSGGCTSSSVFEDLTDYSEHLSTLGSSCNIIRLTKGRSLTDGSSCATTDADPVCPAIFYRYQDGRNKDAFCPIGTEMVISAAGIPSTAYSYTFTPSPNVILTSTSTTECSSLSADAYTCDSGFVTLRFSDSTSFCSNNNNGSGNGSGSGSGRSNCPNPPLGSSYGECSGLCVDG